MTPYQSYTSDADEFIRGRLMNTKKSPTGFIAVCQCGLTVGALDYERTDRKEAGKIIGGWIHDGCKIEPMFESSWEVTCNQCRCDSAGDKP